MTLWLPAAAAESGGVAEDPVGAERIIFLDRDGVLIEDRHYIRSPGQVVLIPGAARALRLGRAAGFGLVGVSNQSGIGRGLYTEADFRAVQRQVDASLAAEGVWLDALYYCPHAPEAHCGCRKPADGLLIEAVARFRWRAEESWLVGDKAADMELALGAGLGALLVETGQGQQESKRLAEPERVTIVPDLIHAVDHILEGERP